MVDIFLILRIQYHSCDTNVRSSWLTSRTLAQHNGTISERNVKEYLYAHIVIFMLDNASLVHKYGIWNKIIVVIKELTQSNTKFGDIVCQFANYVFLKCDAEKRHCKCADSVTWFWFVSYLNMNQDNISKKDYVYSVLNLRYWFILN